MRDRFGVSERRACKVVGIHRSTQRLERPPITNDEAELRAWLRKFSTERPRWGWRRAAKMARRAGWHVNNKRVRRLWREEGLRVPQRRRKKRLVGIGIQVGAFSPIRPNVVWAMDFQFDTTADGRQMKLLNIVDEFTRECLAIEVDRSIDADHVVAVLDRIALQRGVHPVYVRFDNGPEFVAHAIDDWCRVQRHRSRVHRSRLALAKRLDRKLQRATPRRTPQQLAVRFDARSTSHHRGPSSRLQRQQTPHRPRRPHPNRVRSTLEPDQPTPSRIATGPPNGLYAAERGGCARSRAVG